MKYQIYQITNKINGKIYIGKHECSCDKCKYFGSGKLLKKAIKKHGLTNFTKTILFEYNKEQDMIDKEKELVTKEFCKENTNYNLCEGGKGGFGYINSNGKNIYGKNGQKGYGLENLNPNKLGSKLTKKYKDSISKGLLQKYTNGHHWIGKKHTQETLQKMRDIRKGMMVGEKNSQYGTMWITNGVINKKIKKDNTLPDGFIKGRI